MGSVFFISCHRSSRRTVSKPDNALHGRHQGNWSFGAFWVDEVLSVAYASDIHAQAAHLAE